MDSGNSKRSPVSRKTLWSGAFVVCVTPFTENGSMDDEAARVLIDTLIVDGAEGIVVAGSTGEWFAMSEDEKIQLFQIAAQHNRGRVKLIAGVSSMDTASAVRMTSAAKENGFDGALLLPPPYILPTERELLGFFRSVDEVGLPLMLYNNPSRTGINLDAKLLRKTLVLDNIVALKESSKDIHQISQTLREHGQEIAIFCGMETYLVPSVQRGAVGVVAMTPNIIGSQAIALFKAATASDWNGCIRLQRIIDVIYDCMYGWSYNPYVVIKEAMRLVGRPGGWPRPPLTPLTNEDRQALRKILVNIEVLPK
jgi:4-hydroxy-tetrahydrodipicolinate synthase